MRDRTAMGAENLRDWVQAGSTMAQKRFVFLSILPSVSDFFPSEYTSGFLWWCVASNRRQV